MSRFLSYMLSVCLALILVAGPIPLQVSLLCNDSSSTALRILPWHAAHAVQAKQATTKKQTKRAQKSKSKKSTKNSLQKPKTATPGNNFKGAVLYDHSLQKIIFERRADVQIAPASLTKILSMYVAHDIMKAKNIPLSTKVKVSPKAAGKGGSCMGLRSGEVVTIEQLFFGMAVSSGNDAATALAEHFGKTEAGFVALMNKKAKQLGMTRSVFKNASGLPAQGQLTTARDMLTLARRYMADYPHNLKKYHTFKTYTYKGRTTSSANPLLGNFPGADGLKTGFVNASGYNIIATSRQDNVRLIGVLLGAPTSSVRSQEISALMKAGYGKKASMYASTEATGKTGKAATATAKRSTKKSATKTATPTQKTATKQMTAKQSTAQKTVTAKKTTASTAKTSSKIAAKAPATKKAQQTKKKQPSSVSKGTTAKNTTVKKTTPAKNTASTTTKAKKASTTTAK